MKCRQQYALDRARGDLKKQKRRAAAWLGCKTFELDHLSNEELAEAIELAEKEHHHDRR